MSHDFTPISDPLGRPRMKCQRCLVEVIVLPGINLSKVFPRCGEAKPTAPSGPGTEFGKLVASLGLTTPCSACSSLMADMNAWGPDGCESHRVEILDRLRENESQLGWGEWLKAGSKAFLAGYLSIGGLLDEAIRRARAEIIR
jgi:hypothetical protein